MTNPVSQHSEPFKVRVYETGRDEKAHIGAVADWLQEAATIHAAKLGFSHHAMAEAGVAWVLSRMCIRMDRYPGRTETVTVRTWPTERNKRRAGRDFMLTGEDGAPIGCATSAWVALDLATRRLGSMPEFVLAAFPDTDERSCEFTGRALPRMDADGDGLAICARASDADWNGHVNNVNLLKWGLEPVADGRQRFAPAVVDVMFRAEVMPGDHVTARAQAGEDGAMLHALTREDGTEAVRMLTLWP